MKFIKILKAEENKYYFRDKCNDYEDGMEVQEITHWDESASNQYENMIYTWTNLDVKKLETFKKKNLNHKIFYTETEFNKWLEKNNAL